MSSDSTGEIYVIVKDASQEQTNGGNQNPASSGVRSSWQPPSVIAFFGMAVLAMFTDLG